MLSPAEKNIDRQIREWQKKKDMIVKAVRYKKTNESERIDQLICKWRDVCQSASNYLLNSMQLKIMHSGGYRVWKEKNSRKDVDRAQEQEQRIEELNDIVNSEEFGDLSTLEQSDIMDHLHDLSKDSLTDTEDNNEEEEFTMQMLYKMLNIDYDTVYP
ncbi:Piso0_002712 [Millerozyma farinosa CBS 7064]|uniref:Piso0_002712 protein n=1 Tax=Pichia sorbitophila (strain ATCC MYA-4447 / BCRC 22081 / CBS 7064 / NBRC 10061 / NRRL Y-12695) TaxID=559304 RepID=G8YFS1_PICSO|nr:Piso0_002712 [Millerozyma farinosa CBS 7064]